MSEKKWVEGGQRDLVRGSMQLNFMHSKSGTQIEPTSDDAAKKTDKELAQEKNSPELFSVSVAVMFHFNSSNSRIHVQPVSASCFCKHIKPHKLAYTLSKTSLHDDHAAAA